MMINRANRRRRLHGEAAREEASRESAVASYAPAEPVVLPSPIVGEVTAIEQFPPTVAKAILKTIGEIDRLMKDSTNDYANYAYASIDQYYEKSVPVIRANGLSVTAECYDIMPMGPDLLYKFNGVLMYKDGTRYKVGIVAIPHQFQGPQTAGSATSYAEKVLMRAFFKIASGEPDADRQHQTRGSSARVVPMRGNQRQRYNGPVHDAEPEPPRVDPVVTVAEREPEPAVVVPEIPKIPIVDLPGFVADARTVQALNRLWTEQRVSGIADKDGETYDWLLKLFSHRKAKITAAGASALSGRP